MDEREMLTAEGLRKLLSDVWNLGQTYWRQADSEFASDNRRSDDTYKKYRAIVDESCERLADAARRTTPDREAVITAAQRVVRDALDDVRVHPCDEHNDEMRANGLSELMYGLYAALKTAPTSDKGGA